MPCHTVGASVGLTWLHLEIVLRPCKIKGELREWCLIPELPAWKAELLESRKDSLGHCVVGSCAVFL
eukprot:1926981-Rhodomonas_salina.2